MKEPPPPGQSPVFFDPAEWRGDLLLGKSLAEIEELTRRPIDTRVTLSFRGATLRTVVTELAQKTGLGIGITPELVAAEPRPIDLDVHDLPARHVLDWVTRLIDAHYAIEGPQTIFITRDRLWASQDRVTMQHYSVGTLAHVGEPIPGRFQRDAQDLLQVLNYCLRHPMTGHTDARLLLDDTGSRLTAILPPRGQAKLRLILEELKKPRIYEPPAPDGRERERLRLAAIPIKCDFTEQDIRRIADELGRRARVNIGFDYRLIPEDRRTITLNLGETTLGQALDSLAKTAGLGAVLHERHRAFWIFAKGQEPRALLRTTGELPWDRAVVRSIYIEPLVRQFGIELILAQVRGTVTRGEWDSDLPVGFYHEPSGRLVVLHDPECQQAVAECIEQFAGRTRPEPAPGAER